MPGRSPNRRKEETLKHLGKGWFPANSQLLHDIKEKIIAGEYENQRQNLLNDIKADPALFTYCSRILRNFVDSMSVGINPLEELMRIEEDKLRQLFAVNEKDISAHQSKNMSQQQALSLQHTLLSSHAAEAIAEKVQIPTDLAFSSASFRQLGLNLISWNYPRIYSQAIISHRRHDANLNMQIYKFLGASPIQIGAQFAAEWGMRPEIRRVLPTEASSIHKRRRTNSDPTDSDSEQRITMLELCELSELFAQLKDPVNYPQAEDKWEDREAFVRERFGLELFQAVEQKVGQIICFHSEISTAVLSLPLTQQFIEQRVQLSKGQELMNKNSALLKCSEQIQQAFLEVYNRIEDSKVSIEALTLLVDAIVPKLGFKNGCLFLVDRESLNLKPALRIGKHSLADFASFLLKGNHGITSSLHSPVPFRKDGVSIDGTQHSHICGSLDNYRHPGVLYLELSPRSTEQHSRDAILYFHAIRQTLNDCFREED